VAISSYTFDYLLSVAPLVDKTSHSSILELGEATTNRLDLINKIDRIADATGLSRGSIEAELRVCHDVPPQNIPYTEARAIYRWVFGCGDYQAVDLGARDPSYRVDLNYPFDLGREFDVVVNNGTSEHIFNQANVFQMMHNHVKPGGLLVHYTPCLGWTDHGFYNVQPMFFYDIARANSYKVVSCALVGHTKTLPLVPGEYKASQLAATKGLENSLMCACLQRVSSEPFRYPMQYIYA
jgi:SAM-dependent methyltransferase